MSHNFAPVWHRRSAREAGQIAQLLGQQEVLLELNCESTCFEALRASLCAPRLRVQSGNANKMCSGKTKRFRGRGAFSAMYHFALWGSLWLMQRFASLRTLNVGQLAKTRASTHKKCFFGHPITSHPTLAPQPAAPFHSAGAGTSVVPHPEVPGVLPHRTQPLIHVWLNLAALSALAATCPLRLKPKNSFLGSSLYLGFGALSPCKTRKTTQQNIPRTGKRSIHFGPRSNPGAALHSATPASRTAAPPSRRASFGLWATAGSWLSVSGFSTSLDWADSVLFGIARNRK